MRKRDSWENTIFSCYKPIEKASSYTHESESLWDENNERDGERDKRSTQLARISY